MQPHTLSIVGNLAFTLLGGGSISERGGERTAIDRILYATKQWVVSLAPGGNLSCFLPSRTYLHAGNWDSSFFK